MTTRPLPPFDKYYYYSEAVQSPDEDMLFAEQVYREVSASKRLPKTMREDFCGTFANSLAWIRRGPDREAVGVDLDPEPLAWGRKHRLANATPDEARRLTLLRKNVMGKDLPKCDMISAMNFSYYIFKERETLKQYFANCLRTLNKNGVLLLDTFGGSRCHEPTEDEINFDKPKFDYFWDQDKIDPLTHDATFYIHFKRPGEKRREKVFTYEWRLWSPPEVRDVLLDAGFKKVHFYWEGITEDGGGDGEFKIVKEGEACESWIAYLAAVK